MSKPTGVHRLGTYTTDCQCKTHSFRIFREAKEHCRDCDRAKHVWYNPQIGGPSIVYGGDESA